MKSITFEPANNSLATRIRNTRSGRLTLHSPRLENVDGKVTVLDLYSGSSRFGTVRTSTRRQAERLTSASTVNLTLGWDSDRNETVEAEFLMES